MIDEYLNYLYETEIDTGLGGVAKVNIKGKRDREDVEIPGDAGSGVIKASVGTKKKVEEALIGDEDKVERHIDVAAGVIVKRDDNNTQLALLIQRAKDDHWPNVWEFPRGKCDKPIGESILKCAAREIKEETGLDVVPEKLIDRYEYIADHGKRKSYCHVFICHMKDPSQEPKLSKEHQMYKWVGEAGETELMLMPDQKRILAKVLNPERKIINYPEGRGPKKVEEWIDYVYESRWKRLLAQGKITRQQLSRIKKHRGKPDPLYVKQLLRQGKKKQADAYLRKRGIVKTATQWFAGIERGTQRMMRKKGIRSSSKFSPVQARAHRGKKGGSKITSIYQSHASPNMDKGRFIIHTKAKPKKKEARAATIVKRHEAEEAKSGLSRMKKGVHPHVSGTRGGHQSDEILRRERELVRTSKGLYGKGGGIHKMSSVRRKTKEYETIPSKKQIKKIERGVIKKEKRYTDTGLGLGARLKKMSPEEREKFMKTLRKDADKKEFKYIKRKYGYLLKGMDL